MIIIGLGRLLYKARVISAPMKDFPVPRIDQFLIVSNVIGPLYLEALKLD